MVDAASFGAIKNNSSVEQPKTNKEYKDSVFRKLFNDEKNALELYNAIEGTDYPEDTEIILRTLDGTLGYHQKNDLAFQIGKKFVCVYEHQSSLNPNMSLRMLPYIAEIYGKIFDRRASYGETLIKIPTPQFIVLYNGKKEYPKEGYETVLKLSDAYEERQEKYSLELEVRVININYNPTRPESHSPVLDASPNLYGYSILVSRIREYERCGYPRDNAINSAIQDCVDAGYLVDFLKNNWSEVFNMLYSEYSYEDDIAIKTQEAMEKGMEKGRKEGEKIGMERGMEKGIMKIIRNMLANGKSFKEIIRDTGLTSEELEKLLKNKDI